MEPPKLLTQTIKALRRDLQARRFAVPKLQRNFVWNARRAAKLLDSVYYNMPIGSLFLWEMDRRSAHLIRQSAEVLPSFRDTNSRIWFVIDGQQRLSVIYQAFEGDTRQNDAGRSIDFGRLCFVVRPDREQERPAQIVHRKPQGTDLVPLTVTKATLDEIGEVFIRVNSQGMRITSTTFSRRTGSGKCQAMRNGFSNGSGTAAIAYWTTPCRR